VSTDLFQALTLGLLVIVILALLVAVSMLGKVRAALEGRPRVEGAGPSPQDESEQFSVATVDEAVAEVAGAEPDSSGGARTAGEPVAVEEISDAETGDAEEDSERPFERGGRWFFRRGGELLVYEEGTGEWVPASADESAADQGVERQAEEVEASTEPAVAELSDEPAEVVAELSDEPDEAVAEVVEERSDAGALEPSTSFAGQPLAAAEEEVATLGGDSVSVEGAAVATGFEEPGGGAVDLAEAAAAEEPTTRAGETFWKCESCGAINGSTAASCRMCFSPRP
jgi:hypothetical protein